MGRPLQELDTNARRLTDRQRQGPKVKSLNDRAFRVTKPIARIERSHNIVRRRITKQATRRPEEYVSIVNSFLRVRSKRFSANTSRAGDQVDPELAAAAFLYRILNLDETPIPFEYLDGHINSLHLGDGRHRLKPKLIFHGMPPPTGRILQEEGHLYSPDVTIEFNETAYNNEELFKRSIEEELQNILGQEELLLVMDVVAFHKTRGILDCLRDHRVICAFIPGGCTSLLQPLDTTINRPFKDWLLDATEEYVMQREAEGKTDCIKDIPTEAIDFTGWQEADNSYTKDEETVDPSEDNDVVIVAGDDDDIHQTELWVLRIPELKELCEDTEHAVTAATLVTLPVLPE
ncbi:hypothetical protein S7711_09825 [Stachybotrys chartarum IBT 7711]|uniref:DDE-1 domain-containing protein n=1 Tax=Stachybotrys chartarum (strain CBS 109288 / IBT 7711) TaxID=1280523 RepID=A0A084AU47_STACB|nr:hypothetical protein S7711_09825 [Stachybotrys chartarum IBT 7711]